ncbi:YkvA family protein [Flavobacterium sp. UBA6031]|uniref:YkvA family protein n=1 Tax=Flavobacterium sp. UBA6031 TaxID=1946551 RepID=UPI0025BCAF47|nr:DUF1232 domain-containing protein [Flavobacterium sp. UBA6031]
MRFIRTLKKRAKELKTEILAIYLSMKDCRTPLLAKIIIILTISYALSPIDLIPDFIPFFGYLDDLIILPLLINASIKLIPNEVLVDCRIKAKENININKKFGIYSAIIIVIIWFAFVAFVLSKLISHKK